MTDAVVSRLGEIDATSSDWAGENALFLKVFAGEVLAAFARKTATMSRHTVRTISHGKSAQFPRTGRTSAAYHVPGAEILGSVIQHNEKVISINDLLLSDSFIANIDEAKNHYDVRGIYSGEQGIALANQMDRHVFHTMIQAAQQTTAAVGSEADMVGTVIANADLVGTDMATEPDTLIEAIFAAAQALDEKDVPEDNRCAFLKPEHYYMLANSTNAVNVDFGNTGNGSTASGNVFFIAGVELVKTNNLPTTNITTATTDAGTDDRQIVDARNTVGIVQHSSAVGTVKLMDLASEMEYDIRRQGTLLVSKYAMGHGELRPESAVQLRTATPV